MFLFVTLAYVCLSYLPCSHCIQKTCMYIIYMFMYIIFTYTVFIVAYSHSGLSNGLFIQSFLVKISWFPSYSLQYYFPCILVHPFCSRLFPFYYYLVVFTDGLSFDSSPRYIPIVFPYHSHLSHGKTTTTTTTTTGPRFFTAFRRSSAAKNISGRSTVGRGPRISEYTVIPSGHHGTIIGIQWDYNGMLMVLDRRKTNEILL